MKCAPSALLTTSTAWMPLAISCPMRWNTRSAPERSTRTVMPGNFRLERLGEFLRDRQIHRGVEGELAFLRGGLDQRRRDRLGSRRARLRSRRPRQLARMRDERAGGDRREQIASGKSNPAHYSSQSISVAAAHTPNSLL